MNNNIKLGDLVQLNSGSPDLTVDHIDGDLITVVWFDDEGSMEFASFHAVCLTHS